MSLPHALLNQYGSPLILFSTSHTQIPQRANGPESKNKLCVAATHTESKNWLPDRQPASQPAQRTEPMSHQHQSMTPSRQPPPGLAAATDPGRCQRPGAATAGP